MIDEEDTAHPLTDDQIASICSRRGIQVTRPHRGQVSRGHAHPQHASAPDQGVGGPTREASPRRPETRGTALGKSYSHRPYRFRQGTVLKTFEDLGYYCVDNLPVAADSLYFQRAARGWRVRYQRRAARCLLTAREGEQIDKRLPALYHSRFAASVAATLVVRRSDRRSVASTAFSETRRPHPLSQGRSLVREGVRRRAPCTWRPSASWRT